MSPAIDATTMAFLEAVPVGCLATTTADGKVRQSVVYFAVESDQIVISTESKRGKARDVERTGTASLCVQGPAKPYPSVTLEGPARIVRNAIGPPTARIWARIAGSPPGDAMSDEELAAIDRVILAIDVDRVYGASNLEAFLEATEQGS